MSQAEIGTTVETIYGTAVVVAHLPHSVAVRVEYLDKKTQRKNVGKADVLYPTDLSVQVSK